MDETWNDYARPGIASYITMRRRGTAGSGEGKKIVSFAERSHGQGVENVVDRATENAERLESQQGERKDGSACFLLKMCLS